MKKRILMPLLLCVMVLGNCQTAEAGENVQSQAVAEAGNSQVLTEAVKWNETVGDEEVFEGSSEWVNPLAGGREQGKRVQTEEVPSTGIGSYSTVTSAAKYVKRQMMARNGSFSYEYRGSNLNSANIQQTINRVFDKACSVTSAPQEGDYLRYHLTYIKWSFQYTSTKATITWTVEYSSDAAEEQQMKARIGAAVSELGLTYDAEAAKIKKIHDYVCRNVSYYSDGTWNSHSAYSALVNGRAVCQGYATLFYALCKQAGIDVRCVSGSSNGQNHLWNIVKIDQSWYNLDTTWDSTKNGVSYNYFLKSEKDFKAHIRDMEYTTVEFHQECPMSAVSYSGSVGIPVLKSAVSVGSTQIKLSWNKVNTAEGYYIYYAVGKNGKFKKLKSIKGGAYNALTVSGLVPGKVYRFKIRAYASILGECISGDSDIKSAKPVPGKVDKPSVKSQSGALKVTWNMVDGAKGYEILITYKKNGADIRQKINVRATTKKKLSKTVKNLPRGTACRVKVRAYASGTNGKYVYGNYSQSRKKGVK